MLTWKVPKMFSQLENRNKICNIITKNKTYERKPKNIFLLLFVFKFRSVHCICFKKLGGWDKNRFKVVSVNRKILNILKSSLRKIILIGKHFNLAKALLSFKDIKIKGF